MMCLSGYSALCLAPDTAGLSRSLSRRVGFDLHVELIERPSLGRILFCFFHIHTRCRHVIWLSAAIRVAMRTSTKTMGYSGTFSAETRLSYLNLSIDTEQHENLNTGP